MKKFLVNIVLLGLLSVQSAFADTINSVIHLKNGSTISGNITEKNMSYVKIKISNSTEITILVNDIESISAGDINENIDQKIKELEYEKQKLEKSKKDLSKVIKLEDKIDDSKKKIENLQTNRKEDWFQNPNYTRMFFAPTARPLKKGDGYLQDINLFCLAANYGINDNLSIGGIASLIPGINTNQQILAFTPKIGVEISKDLSLGGGLLYVSGAGFAQVGVVYGVATYGTVDTNLTLGIGGAYGNISKAGFFPQIGAKSVVEGAGALVTMVGGMHRIAEHISVVSENWIFNNNFSKDQSYLFSYGFRFFWDKSSWDVAVMYPVIPQITSYPLPYIDYVWHF